MGLAFKLRGDPGSAQAQPPWEVGGGGGSVEGSGCWGLMCGDLRGRVG